MAKALIAHLVAYYYPADAPGGRGRFVLDGGYLCDEERMYADLEARCRGQPYPVQVDIRPVRDKRTLDQNRLMWALLNKLALALSGGTPGGVTAEACYMDMLQEYGAEVEVWRVPYKALDALRKAYRVVQLVELLDGGQCIVRVGVGSSQFDRQQMAGFIDRIFDRLAELGVDDAETTQQYRDWRAAQ